MAALGRCWVALRKLLGSSWTLLGSSWALLGCSWAALERSWAPSWSQDGRQEAQRRPLDLPKSKPRRCKTMLTYKKLFRTPSWELQVKVLGPSCRKLGAPGAPKSWTKAIEKSICLYFKRCRRRCAKEAKGLHQNGAA